jgi:hypothetical protein
MKNKSLILGLVSTIFTCNLIFTSCSEPKEVEKYTLIEKRIYTAEDSVIDQYPRMKGDAHGGAYFSRTDSTNQYGIGTVMMINDTNLNKDLRVNVNFWCRANVIEPGYLFAVSLVDGDKMALWHEMDVKKQIKSVNTWTNVVDSVTIPAAAMNKPGLVLKAFAFNPNNPAKTIVFDSDDMEITFKKVEKIIEE